MVKIASDNKDNCEKVVKELDGYVNKHKKEFEEIAKAGAQMEQKMSEEEKKQLEERVLKKFQSMMIVTMEISQKCPAQAARVAELMGTLSRGGESKKP